jgi:hypothetical protein
MHKDAVIAVLVPPAEIARINGGISLGLWLPVVV